MNEKAETVIKAAKDQLGSPYVFGTWGDLCTPTLRKRYSGYNPSHKDAIYKACPVLTGKQEDCEGCRYEGDLAFDCRGFTHWCLLQAGIDIKGSGATSQYNTAANWMQKGSIEDMPDVVCCVFKKSGKTMQHTGLHIGNGMIIHCSSGVQYGKITQSGWTHYAIPAGLYEEGDVAVVKIMKNGSKGENVRALQESLNKLGYKCGDADGIFGMRTETAVRLFQADHLLTQDGIAGDATQEAIAIALARQETQAQMPAEKDPDEILVLAVRTATEALEAVKKIADEALRLLKEGGEQHG